ncbi:RING/U-box superfamily protein [Actinidia rufa]|uniref:RING/U-box superfamily protein n=1 Tax=Actinidia rufa TaxID=165716 RepID=A0A7J0HCW1_9ERIC|nr:RING/U-box superfamily protein [Actinidia rufa]
MGDEIPNAMNLDLNLGPSPSPDNELGSGSLSNESVNLEDWIDRQQYNRYREALRIRARQRLRSFLRPVSIPPEARNIALELMINSSNGGGAAGGGLQTGEGSVSSEGRNDEAIKTCENNVTHEGNDVLGKKEDEEKDAKECPVCKGEVAIKNLTPIYGRGNTTEYRQCVRESPERNNSLLNRILTSRGMRREQNTVIPQEDIVDVGLTPTSPTNSDVGESRRFSSLFRRSHAHRAATISNLTSALSSPERFVESYFHYHHAEINHEQPPPVDDRDSVSSIAAAIHSESQTVDTAVEIDSTVSLSTSSSRRRNDASRVSDVDSGESRAYRRRRLN